jgi:head-tail adaptor
MALPRKLSGQKYLSNSAFNSYITIINPNTGQAANGTPNAPTTVVQTHANVSPWRSKEIDQNQTRVGTSSYKIVVRYPKTYSVDTGMQIMLRNQVHNIDSLYDPDGQQVELHIFTFVNNDTVGAQ